MFQHILLPLDGSLSSEAALPVAERLTRSARAQLHLVLAHERVAALIGTGGPVPDYDAQARRCEQSYLQDVAESARRAAAVSVDCAEVSGPAGPAIAEEATRVGADLVVMAGHGRGALGRLWSGSVADYLVRHLTVPILLTPPNRKEQMAEANPLRSILVALDLSAYAEAILEPVIALSQVTKGHVTLIHVEEPVGAVDPGFPFSVLAPPKLAEEQRIAVQRRLDEIADRLRYRGVSVSTRLTLGAGAAGGLLDALAGGRYDVLALTTHGQGGLKRLLMGSVADKVIRAAPKPVLVLRPTLVS